MAFESLNRPERLDFLALRFTCRAHDGFSLENPFSDLHGGFGLMLHAHYRLIYEDLFGDQRDSGMVRTYVLRPLNALQQAVQAGQPFAFELVLIGASARYWMACAEAFERLGTNGVTSARYRFGIECIEQFSPQGILRVWSADQGWQVRNLVAASAAELLAEPFLASEWEFHFLTPIAIKTGNDLLRSTLLPIPFAERLLGRVQLLATQQGGGPLLDAQTKGKLLGQASGIEVLENQTWWQPASRYSRRQRRSSEFGGLVGNIRLRGEVSMLGRWFHLAPWLHVGSKTSFGLGQCAIVKIVERR